MSNREFAKAVLLGAAIGLAISIPLVLFILRIWP